MGNSATQTAAAVAAAAVVFNDGVTCKPANHNSVESIYFLENWNWKQIKRRSSSILPPLARSTPRFTFPLYSSVPSSLSETPPGDYLRLCSTQRVHPPSTTLLSLRLSTPSFRAHSESLPTLLFYSYDRHSSARTSLYSLFLATRRRSTHSESLSTLLFYSSDHLPRTSLVLSSQSGVAWNPYQHYNSQSKHFSFSSSRTSFFFPSRRRSCFRCAASQARSLRNNFALARSRDAANN